MFPRLIKHSRKNKEYQYLKISESYRNKAGKSTTRDISNLGNVENYTQEDISNIIDGLIKIFKLEDYALSDDVEMLESLEYGNIILWQKLWNTFDLSSLIKKHIHKKFKKVEIKIEKYVEMMTVNRCIFPSSKLGMTRWINETCYKDMKDYSEVSLNVTYFYRSMDYLLAIKDELEMSIFLTLKNFFCINVKLTFYDITSTFFTSDNCPLSKNGYSRDHRPDCEQIVVGVVTSYEGFPLKHYVFTGNTADSTTVQSVVHDLKSQFHIEETIFVGDRGMITTLNLQEIERTGFDYIMGVKLRQDQLCQMNLLGGGLNWEQSEEYNTITRMIEKTVPVKDFIIFKARQILSDHTICLTEKDFNPFVEKIMSFSNEDEPTYKTLKPFISTLSSDINYKICRKIVDVIKRYIGRFEHNYRFVYCLNSEKKELEEQTRTAYIEQISQDLDELFSDKKGKKKMTISETEKVIATLFQGYRSKYRKFFTFARDKKTQQAIRYELNLKSISYEQQFDGIFALLCSKSQEDLPTAKVVESYTNLQEVELLYDDLKNFVDIRPVRHWLEKRVRAHVFICILALLLKRTFEINGLKSKSVMQPLEELRKVKLVKYKVKYSQREERGRIISKVTTVNPLQRKYFKMAGINDPMNVKKFLWCEKIF